MATLFASLPVLAGIHGASSSGRGAVVESVTAVWQWDTLQTLAALA